MPAFRLFVTPMLLCACSMLLGACSENGVPAPDVASKDAALADAALADDAPADSSPGQDGASPDIAADATSEGTPPLECFELSLDPEIPLAIDGVFSAADSRWFRPHSDEETCPASPTTAEVPFVAFAFCNNDSQAHTFDVELIASEGPNGEPALDDPYLVLYAGRNIPPDPQQCLAINDTIPDALDSNDAEVLGLSVPGGGAVTVVATTYAFNPGTSVGTGYYILVISKSAL